MSLNCIKRPQPYVLALPSIPSVLSSFCPFHQDFSLFQSILPFTSSVFSPFYLPFFSFSSTFFFSWLRHFSYSLLVSSGPSQFSSILNALLCTLPSPLFSLLGFSEQFLPHVPWATHYNFLWVLPLLGEMSGYYIILTKGESMTTYVIVGKSFHGLQRGSNAIWDELGHPVTEKHRPKILHMLCFISACFASEDQD